MYLQCINFLYLNLLWDNNLWRRWKFRQCVGRMMCCHIQIGVSFTCLYCLANLHPHHHNAQQSWCGISYTHPHYIGIIISWVRMPIGARVVHKIRKRRRPHFRTALYLMIWLRIRWFVIYFELQYYVVSTIVVGLSSYYKTSCSIPDRYTTNCCTTSCRATYRCSTNCSTIDRCVISCCASDCRAICRCSTSCSTTDRCVISYWIVVYAVVIRDRILGPLMTIGLFLIVN